MTNRKIAFRFSSVVVVFALTYLDNDAFSQTTSQSASAYGSKTEEVVVTAEKRVTKLKDTPISMTVMLGRNLDKQTLSGLTALLNTVPSVSTNVGFQGGGTQVTIRGVSAAGPLFAGAGTVAYYLDGMPFGFVRSAVGPDLDPYDLQRVEVLRGPQGTLYGAGGLNGVVRVLTNDPNLSKLDFKSRAVVSGTKHGGANGGGDAELNVPIVKDRFAVRAVVGDNDYSGWINSVKKRDVNDSNLQNYRIKLRARPVDNLLLDFSYWRTDDHYGAPSDGVSNYNAQLLSSPMNNITNGYSGRLTYEANYFTITSQTSHLGYASNSYTDLNPEGLSGYQGITDLKSRVLTEEVNIVSKKLGPWSWNAGVLYRDARDKIYEPFKTPTSMLIYDNFADSSVSEAVYGQISRRFMNNKLSFSAGLRYFHDSQSSQALSGSALGAVSLKPYRNHFNAVTPRIVLQYLPDKKTSFYASYSQGFRSGLVQDEEVTVISPDVQPARPDRLHNFEIGVKGNQFNGALDYSLSAFYIYWKNVQQVLQTPVGNGTYVGAIVNGSSASGAGIDFSLNAHLSSRLKAGLFLGWNGLTEDRAVYSESILLFSKGERLNYSPEYTAGANLNYDFPVGSHGMTGELGSSLNYTSSQTTTTLGSNNRIIMAGDPMLMLGAHASLNSVNGRWSGTLFGNNLTDESGSPIKSAASMYFDLRVRPRTIGLQIDYHL